jgi:hypothetical protein
VASRDTGLVKNQIVILETDAVYAALMALKETFGLSQAEIARRCIRAGLTPVRVELERERRAVRRAQALKAVDTGE